MIFNQEDYFILINDLVGFASIGFVTLFFLLIATKKKTISKILLVALALRIFVLLLGHYFIELPDTSADAETFEEEAWNLGKYGIFNVLNNFEGPSPRFISWLIAIPYSLFGRSLLMAQSISLFFGMATVYFGWKVSCLIWNNQVGIKVAWMIALFPSLVLYSVIVLREVYISFFLLIGLYGIVKWYKSYSFKSLIIIICGFLTSTFFHGAMFVGIIVFAIFFGFLNIKIFWLKIKKYKINKENFLFLFFLILFFIFLASNKISVPYLHSFDKMVDISRIQEYANQATRGNASWPDFLKFNSQAEFFYKAPLRAIYFVMSPFPWDIKSMKHIVGLLDSFLYIYLLFLIIKNLKVIWSNPALKVILIILILYIIAFGLGVGNFGTAIRHKTKFTVIFILLAGPLLKKIYLFKKYNQKKIF